ncbi:MAG: hypothetical protein ACOC10_10780 [Bacteroidota bacterium]
MNYNSRFYGNLYSCPAGRRNPDCPVSAIQNLTFAEKVDWFDALSPKEQKEIEEHHKLCVVKR